MQKENVEGITCIFDNPERTNAENFFFLKEKLEDKVPLTDSKRVPFKILCR